MISSAQHRLIKRCRLSAMVVGHSDGRTRFFWLSETNVLTELTELLDQGFFSCGLLGFDSGLHLEPDSDTPDAARLLKLAASDFLLAAVALKAGAPSN